MPDTAPASATGPARTVGLLVAAAVVVVATVVLVATLGVARPPALAPVDAATRPAARLAYLSWRTDGGQCLFVVERDATVREVRCGLDASGPLLGWDDTGILLLRYVAGIEQRETIDPVTGATLGRTALAPLGATPPVPAQRFPVTSERRDGVLVVRDGDGREVWRVEAPEGYALNGSAFAPDGTLAVLDSARRLLVLPVGAAAPRVWVEDLGSDWIDPVWEGTPALRE
jgi:hypothetical protein